MRHLVQINYWPPSIVELPCCWLHVLFVLFKNISLEQSSSQMECLNSRFERLREVISSTPPQVLPHWQVRFKVGSSLRLLNLVLLDLVGNKSHNNLFSFVYWKILALGQNVTPSQARGVTNDRGPIFFSNDRKKGYYKVSKCFKTWYSCLIVCYNMNL